MCLGFFRQLIGRELLAAGSLAVGGEGCYGLLATGYLLGERGLAGAVLARVSFNNIVHAGHISVQRASGEQRQGVGNGDAQRWLLLVFIVGLAEGAYCRYEGQSLVVAPIVKGFHGGKLHGLHLGHLVGTLIAGEGGK